jgi:mono/diheme cytochrome c family protein
MKSLVFAAFIVAFAHSASAVEYAQIKSIFSQKCYACHAVSKGKTKGDLALDTPEKLAEVIKPNGQIIPGDPAKSSLLISCKLPDDDDDSMPPKGKNRLTPAEITALETWIKEGANTGNGPAPMPAPAPIAAPAAAAAPAAGGVQDRKSVV